VKAINHSSHIQLLRCSSVLVVITADSRRCTRDTKYIEALPEPAVLSSWCKLAMQKPTGSLHAGWCLHSAWTYKTSTMFLAVSPYINPQFVPRCKHIVGLGFRVTTSPLEDNIPQHILGAPHQLGYLYAGSRRMKEHA